ncbi:hypothetical protein CR513_52006, partial [Mucuna pruriens]
MNLMRAQIVESRETTMARDSRHSRAIILHYLEELVHQATKVKLQLKRRQVSKKLYPSSSWKGKEKDRLKKDKSPKKGNEPFNGQKEEKAPPTPKRTMVLRENGKVESESSQEESSSSSEVKASNKGSHYKGDLLMVRRLTSNQVVEEAKTQRENIFPL